MFYKKDGIKMKNGFIKVCAATPKLRVADVDFNLKECIRLTEEASNEGAKLIVFPKLTLTGATCGDLFYSNTLTNSAKEALTTYTYATAGLNIISVIGLPYECNDKLYICSAVVYEGQILGLVPQKNIPNTNDASRYFTPSPELNYSVVIGDSYTMLGTKQFFSCPDIKDFRIGVEVGEDVLSNDSPITEACASGALIIANPCAFNEYANSNDMHENAILASSKRNRAAYIHADPSFGESTTDAVYSAHAIICENGNIVKRKAPFNYDEELLITEIDTELLSNERKKDCLFVRNSKENLYCEINFNMAMEYTEITREFPKNPFVPDDTQKLSKVCTTTLWVQAEGLAQRLIRSHSKSAVIGISGGLDSTLALIVAVKAMDILDRPRTDVIAVTMPCFGTSKRTRGNAEILCDELGVTFREVDILNAVEQHFNDIGHDKNLHNVVYENSQARERTQILMDIANKENGLVVGTGDLSELALGWATYCGDHMSMYGVNASVPKTLVRALVRYFADIEKYNENSELSDVLYDILDTPVSPELLPADEDGEISQITEDLVGPYEIHDFYIYYTVKYGFSPEKLYRMAQAALGDYYDDETLLRWLEVFVKRFISQQFKRSCSPDGPCATEISLSPRQGFKMPSDAQNAVWLKEIEELKENI